MWTEFIRLRMGSVPSFYEHGNEQLEFRVMPIDLLDSQGFSL